MCISGVGTHSVHHIGAAENGRKRSFVQKNSYFRSFLANATCNHRTVGGYMSFKWLSFWHEAYMSGDNWL